MPAVKKTTPKVEATAKPTKAAIAREIFDKVNAESKVKIISMFQSKAKLTAAGARTYYYKLVRDAREAA